MHFSNVDRPLVKHFERKGFSRCSHQYEKWRVVRRVVSESSGRNAANLRLHEVTRTQSLRHRQPRKLRPQRLEALTVGAAAPTHPRALTN